MPAQQQKKQQQLQQQQQQPIGTSETLLASEASELSSDSSGGHPAVHAISHASQSEGSSQGDCAEGMESLNQRAVVAVGSELTVEHLSEHGEETSSAEADIAAVSSACAADSGDHGGEEDGADQGHAGVAAPSAGELAAAVNTADAVEVPAMDSDEDGRPLIPAGASASVLVASINCGASCLPAYTLVPSSP